MPTGEHFLHFVEEHGTSYTVTWAGMSCWSRLVQTRDKCQKSSRGSLEFMSWQKGLSFPHYTHSVNYVSVWAFLNKNCLKCQTDFWSFNGLKAPCSLVVRSRLQTLWISHRGNYSASLCEIWQVWSMIWAREYLKMTQQGEKGGVVKKAEQLSANEREEKLPACFIVYIKKSAQEQQWRITVDCAFN